MELEEGIVYATGGNSFGQLGTGNKQSVNIPQVLEDLRSYDIQKVDCGHHSAALSKSGDLFLWGTSSFGVFLKPHHVETIGIKIIDIQLGIYFGTALGVEGSLWTWGANTNGELGLGDSKSRSVPTPIPALQGINITDLCCGNGFSIAKATKLNCQPAPSNFLIKKEIVREQKSFSRIINYKSGTIQRRLSGERSSRVSSVSKEITYSIPKTTRIAGILNSATQKRDASCNLIQKWEAKAKDLKAELMDAKSHLDKTIRNQEEENKIFIARKSSDFPNFRDESIHTSIEVNIKYEIENRQQCKKMNSN